MISTTQLTRIGLSEKEARVYLALVELGEVRVSDLAAHTQINRATVYSLLKSLRERGLVQKRRERGVHVYYIEDVHALEHELAEKRSALAHLLPELAEKHSLSAYKPRIVTYEGQGGLREFFFHILKDTNRGDTVLEYVGSKHFFEVLPKDFIALYPEERVKRKIRVRTITPRTEASSQWDEHSESFLREVRFAPEREDFSSIMQIWDRGIGILSFRENFMGVILESRDIARMARSMFEMMWEYADESGTDSPSPQQH